MSGFICEYCHEVLSSKYTLKSHQQNAKYCLILRGETSKYECQTCHKFFSEHRYLEKHNEKCIQKYTIETNETRLEKENEKLHAIILQLKDTIKQKIDINKTLRRKNTELDKQVAIQKQQIEDLTQINQKQANNIEDLQNKIQDIAVQGMKKSTTTNILNLMPMSQDWLQQQAQQLTAECIKMGITGYANFASNYSFKDRVLCSDANRHNLKYMEDNGLVVRDPKGERLARMFFSSIKDKNTEMVVEIEAEINDELKRHANDAQQVAELQRQMAIIVKLDNIELLTQGKSEKLRSQFVKHLCSVLSNPTIV